VKVTVVSVNTIDFPNDGLGESYQFVLHTMRFVTASECEISFANGGAPLCLAKNHSQSTKAPDW